MWKQTLLSCSLLSPPLQSKAFLLFKRGTQRQQSFTISNGKKDLSASWESNKGQSLPCFCDFSQYANTNILPHTRKVLLTHISQFSPFTIPWCSPSHLSWRTLNSACMNLTQKVHYNYRWIINQAKGPDQNQSKAKSFVPVYPWLVNIDTVLLTQGPLHQSMDLTEVIPISCKLVVCWDAQGRTE